MNWLIGRGTHCISVSISNLQVTKLLYSGSYLNDTIYNTLLASWTYLHNWLPRNKFIYYFSIFENFSFPINSFFMGTANSLWANTAITSEIPIFFVSRCDYTYRKEEMFKRMWTMFTSQDKRSVPVGQCTSVRYHEQCGALWYYNKNKNNP